MNISAQILKKVRAKDTVIFVLRMHFEHVKGSCYVMLPCELR